MNEITGDIVYWIVVIARLLVPLTIPRFPLPGILVSLIIDAVDQTIFQQFPSIPLEGYQGYDKAFDIYYLTIAYLSTQRNWTNQFAFRVSRFLYYWRLVGVALFELTELRLLLLIFPNVFEYFFIFYEAYRLRWNPQRLSKKLTIGAAIAIWIIIKIPQEYWIHIAQIDTTDWLKVSIFQVPLDTGWGLIFRASPGFCLSLIFLIVIGLAAAIIITGRRLSPADHSFSLAGDIRDPEFSLERREIALVQEASEIVDTALGEKMVLSSLVSLSFAQVLPNVRASSTELIIGISWVVVANTVVSHWFARRGFGRIFTIWEFLVLLFVNASILLAYSFWRAQTGEPVNAMNLAFFILLLSLLIALFDRYHQVYLARFG